MPRHIVVWSLVAAACGSNPTAAANGTPVVMQDYSFAPETLTVKVGTTVVWTNAGTVAHTATSDSGDAIAWDSGPLGAPGMDAYGTTPGGMYERTFTVAGTFPYHCTYHVTTHGMRGVVVVTP